ncbi:exodeoxyribonuclease V subunit gamma [Candidatus Sumerlaeota bacterium]|nr:exodeoxyribonuclease V subunit gamma [Candidatus Sumerlaeota bacterium]
MGNLKLYINPNRKPFVDYVLNRCLGFIQEGEFEGFMVVVPTHRWAQSFRQLLLERAPAQFTATPLVFGYHQAIDFLYRRLIDSPDIEISRTERILLGFTILKELYAEIQERNPQLLRIPLVKLAEALEETVDKLKNSNQNYDTIAETLKIDLSAPENTKVYLLCRFLQEYQSRLHAGGYVDFPDKVSAITNILKTNKQAFKSRFPHLEFLTIFGFDLFSQNMYTLIKELIAHVPELAILLEYDKTRPWIFEHLSEPERYFSTLASEVIVESAGPTEDLPGKISYFFYREPQNVGFTDRVEKPFIGLIEGKNPADEIDKICRWLKHLILHNPNVKVEDICLCFPKLEDYLSIIHRILPRYGLPYRVSLPEPFSRSLFSRTIMALVNVVASNYERRAVIQFLQSPYIASPSFAECNDTFRIHTGLLTEIANIQRVVDGKDSWFNALKKEEQTLWRWSKESIDEPESGEEFENGFLSPERAQERLNALSKIRDTLSYLFSRLTALEQPQTIAEFSENLRKIVEDLKLEECIRGYWRKYLKRQNGDGADSELIVRELSAIEQFGSVLGLLSKTSRSFAPELRLSIREFSQLLNVVFNCISLSPVPQRRGAVQVLGKLEPRGVEFDYIIFAGLHDKAFPRPIQPDVILNEDQRNLLHIIPKGEHILSKDLFIFYCYLNQARKKFICSYPQSSDEKLLLPSIVINELGRIADVERISLPAETEMYTLQGLHKQFGKFIRPRLADISDVSEENLTTRIDTLDMSIFPDDIRAHLKNALRMTFSRNYLPQFTEFEGVLNSAELKQTLEAYAKGVFSVSQLEQYGRCPFVFFCLRLLGIEQLAEFEEEFPPLERGKMIHRILYRFYAELKSRNQIPIDSESKAESALRELRRIAEEELEREDYSGVFWEIEKENILGNDSEHLDGLLKAFINLERKRYKKGEGASFIPSFFEVSFGKVPGGREDDGISVETPYIIEQDNIRVALRGRIDRIDVADDEFIIFDYKTSGSKPPGLKELEKGIALQLPIYMLAGQDLMQKMTGRALKCIGSLYYHTRDEATCEIDNFLSFKDKTKIIKSITGRGSERKGFSDEVNKWLEIAKQYVMDYVSKIRNGFFAVRDIDLYLRCKNCAFNRICRGDFILIRAIKRNDNQHT